MQALERTFSFDSQAVRVCMIDGEPWWVASDVASILGYRDGYSAARMLPEDEKGTHSVSTLGGPQFVTIVSESGLYRLIMRSERGEAEAFRRWVFGEVLPSIRKTGSYGAPSLDLRDPVQLAPIALQLARLVEDQQRQLAEAAPKVEHYDRFTDATGRYGLQQAARVIGAGPNTMIKELIGKGVLFRQGRKLVPRADLLDRGLFEVKEVLVDGKAYCQTYVTPKGLQWLARSYTQAVEVAP